ncbi:K(+)-transporting ATPase subunit F [Bosea sp. (in: a-proteobacteria)]|uniref:K(+)-transporting ATPase subunit F n=1 Tax=Bosea vestrisii TaxID=151416 RepID=A0ABW0HE28_9HYPH|nr:K(+)-transporting ATPase subunit F [Bosea sp. (in: a-proteobacteria)]MBR3189853.1 K(+)-transporting ATPase subunit F [Bosea sp. (in: a-proteobacteria)]
MRSSAGTQRCCARSDAMGLTLLYAAAALGLAVYMVAALLRPDRF